MGKRLSFFRRHLRTWVQICFAALTNGYAAGFAKGTIYKGNTKLLNEINEGLKKVVKSGAYAKVYAKWFGEKTPVPKLPIPE